VGAVASLPKQGHVHTAEHLLDFINALRLEGHSVGTFIEGRTQLLDLLGAGQYDDGDFWGASVQCADGIPGGGRKMQVKEDDVRFRVSAKELERCLRAPGSRHHTVSPFLEEGCEGLAEHLVVIAQEKLHSYPAELVRKADLRLMLATAIPQPLRELFPSCGQIHAPDARISAKPR
jgi:hypothetical protein